MRRAMTNLRSVTNDNQEEEDQWKVALVHLQRQIELYKDAKSTGDKEEADRAADAIPEYMHRAADIHPDHDVKAKMNKDADEFANADEKTRESMLHPLAKGLLILLATPFALVGAALFAAGGIVYGTAKVLEGVGKGLAAGPAFIWGAMGSWTDHKRKTKD
ncbi:hypothetical protein B0H21DRAFT_69545 [Amylocystis lapponica]|nr:hypothetical protein B0H21DRAFT_69545 [Amylocystis lapponica]